MIVSFKSYVMNFVDLMLNCYSHITSHVSQAFASFTHYTSCSLLNIVHLIVCVFDLTNQVCKYFEFLCKTNLRLENLWRMVANLNFGKIGFKTCGFEKICISYSCILLIFFNAWKILCKNWAVFSKLVFFFFFDRSRLFSINRNWFKILRWASIYFDWSNLRFRSIKNCVGRFLKPDF